MGKKFKKSNNPVSMFADDDLKVTFSLAKCTSKAKFCIKYLSNEGIRKLYRKLGEYEKYPFMELIKKPRDHGGMCPETIGSESYNKLQEIDDSLDSYYHFRLDGIERIFGGFYKNRFYILLFDPEGKVHRESHK